MQTRWNRMLLAAAVAVGLVLGGCSVDVKKGESGKEEQVDIKTPVGGLKVRTDDVDAADVGLAVYPGATLVQKGDKEESRANVNIATPWFGLKVVALRYETADTPEKVVDFYDKEMKKHGEVTRCNGDLDFKGGPNKREIKCTEKAGEFGLAVGEEQRHRIVSIKKKGDKTEFALVYVNTRGEEDTI